MRSLGVAVYLAYKSVARGNVGVTLLTIGMLALSNLNMLFVPSLVNGIIHSANDKIISTYSGNIIVESTADIPLVKDVQEFASQISAVEGVSAVTYRNRMTAELKFGDQRNNCTIQSISPERERKVFQIADSLVEGSYLDPRDLDQILMGVQIAGADRSNLELYASSLKRVHAGDRITATYSNGIKREYTVKGIFYTEFIQSDLQVFVTEREFKSISPVTENRATSVRVKIDNDADSPRIVSQIAALRDNIKFQTWQETAGLVTSLTNSFNLINGILFTVNLLVAGITVFIVTYIDVTNKRRQIGIERAIGISPVAIALSYVLRAVLYGILGSIISWSLYHYFVVPLEARYPFHFPFGDVMLYISQEQILRSPVIIWLVAVVAALVPVWRSIRIRLLDAIWG